MPSLRCIFEALEIFRNNNEKIYHFMVFPNCRNTILYSETKPNIKRKNKDAQK